MRLSDGRTLDVVDDGGDGPAIVFHHGTPSSAETADTWRGAARAAGLRWVSFSRAGYGGSSRRPGRSVADNCTDVTELVDALDVERFVAIGWSGGGPHALACGALLSARCAGVIALAGVAPWADAAAAGLDWLDGMGQENHDEFGAALEGETPLRAYLGPEGDQLRTITGAQVATALGGLVDAPDRAVLTGAFADHTAASFREALRVGIDGWVDDDLAFVRHWGFELSDVAVPVAVWQGSDDRMVPFAHGQSLAARLPDARPHLLTGEGHLSVVVGRIHEMVAEARTFLGGQRRATGR